GGGVGVAGLRAECTCPPQVARPREALWERGFLEPAVEVLDRAVELGLPLRDEDRADAEAQAQADHPRQGARRRPPAGQLAGVVELDLLRAAQALPARAEEPQDLIHAAGIGQTQANGAVEGI